MQNAWKMEWNEHLMKLDVAISVSAFWAILSLHCFLLSLSELSWLLGSEIILQGDMYHFGVLALLVTCIGALIPSVHSKTDAPDGMYTCVYPSLLHLLGYSSWWLCLVIFSPYPHKSLQDSFCSAWHQYIRNCLTMVYGPNKMFARRYFALFNEDGCPKIGNLKILIYI